MHGDHVVPREGDDPHGSPKAAGKECLAGVMKEREERRRGTIQQDRSARTRKGKQASERVTTRGPLASSSLALPRSVVPDVVRASPGS